MATLPGDRLLTATELYSIPDDGYQYELVQGRLVRTSPSGWRSSGIGGRAVMRIGAFVEARQLGEYGGADGGFLLTSNPDTLRSPDAWFVRASRITPEISEDHFWPFAPDLAVEVISPSDRFTDVVTKDQEYLAAGTRLVWGIDPRARTAGVFRPGQPPVLLDESGVLDGEDVLPGFRLPLRELLNR